jgi:hypothetical protein
MQRRSFKLGLAAGLMVLSIASNPGFADKPDWAGGGKPGKGAAGGQGAYPERGDPPDGPGVSVSLRFEARQRSIARSYYHEEFSRGHCPPGLAKKHNGCMPPGLARKWGVGRPLPRDVVYYELPHALMVELGVPPAGYRYVRVASDILMIAVGSMMVVDAIEDLARQ